MDLKKAGLGVVAFLVFWAFQAGYFSGLGTTAWFVGSIIFVAILFLLGKTMPKAPSEKEKMLWNFSIAFAVVVTLLVSYVAPWMPGIVLPPGGDLSVLTPMLLTFWLVLFGATKFIGGAETKNSLMQLIGVIWLFGSITWVLTSGPNAWLHFAIITSLPFIIAGLMPNKK